MAGLHHRLRVIRLERLQDLAVRHGLAARGVGRIRCFRPLSMPTGSAESGQARSLSALR